MGAEVELVGGQVYGVSFVGGGAVHVVGGVVVGVGGERGACGGSRDFESLLECGRAEGVAGHGVSCDPADLVSVEIRPMCARAPRLTRTRARSLARWRVLFVFLSQYSTLNRLVRVE